VGAAAHRTPVAKPLRGLGFCRFSPEHADIPVFLPAGGGAADALRDDIQHPCLEEGEEADRWLRR
jgi:hypothetical protein